MNEATFQSKFSRWLKYEWPHMTAVFELKFTDGKSIPFKAVKEHQRAALHMAGTRLIYKIPDVGPDQKPMDCFIICESPGFVVVQFYKRSCKTFYVIGISDFEKAERTCGRKSLTEPMAKEMACMIGVLK